MKLNQRICSMMIFLSVLSTMATSNGYSANDLPWKKPSRDELKKKLTPLQCDVTQDGATEQPFQNEFWNNKKPGIYVDIVSGEPLFSSLDKFDSQSGWPSFSKPIDSNHIVTGVDRSLGITRTELKSKIAGSHLGHLFDDGPGPGGMRYCINSASLRFVPVERLEVEGYGAYKNLFSAPSIVSAAASVPAFPFDDFASAIPKDMSVATLAGGCFWGMEDIIRQLKGVVKTQVGYTGGQTEHPTYDLVKTGKTGHAESVQIVFNPKLISYRELLGYFFRMHDPTTMNQQGNDVGTQYRSAIFYYDDSQRETATLVKDQTDKSAKWKKPVVTDIVKAGPFWRAESYHQEYLKKNPTGYTCHYLRP